MKRHLFKFRMNFLVVFIFFTTFYFSFTLKGAELHDEEETEISDEVSSSSPPVVKFNPESSLYREIETTFQNLKVIDEHFKDRDLSKFELDKEGYYQPKDGLDGEDAALLNRRIDIIKELAEFKKSLDSISNSIAPEDREFFADTQEKVERAYNEHQGIKNLNKELNKIESQLPSTLDQLKTHISQFEKSWPLTNGTFLDGTISSFDLSHSYPETKTLKETVKNMKDFLKGVEDGKLEVSSQDKTAFDQFSKRARALVENWEKIESEQAKFLRGERKSSSLEFTELPHGTKLPSVVPFTFDSSNDSAAPKLTQAEAQKLLNQINETRGKIYSHGESSAPIDANLGIAYQSALERLNKAESQIKSSIAQTPSSSLFFSPLNFSGTTISGGGSSSGVATSQPQSPPPTITQEIKPATPPQTPSTASASTPLASTNKPSLGTPPQTTPNSPSSGTPNNSNQIQDRISSASNTTPTGSPGESRSFASNGNHTADLGNGAKESEALKSNGAKNLSINSQPRPSNTENSRANPKDTGLGTTELPNGDASVLNPNFVSGSTIGSTLALQKPVFSSPFKKASDFFANKTSSTEPRTSPAAVDTNTPSQIHPTNGTEDSNESQYSESGFSLRKQIKTTQGRPTRNYGRKEGAGDVNSSTFVTNNFYSEPKRLNGPNSLEGSSGNPGRTSYTLNSDGTFSKIEDVKSARGLASAELSDKKVESSTSETFSNLKFEQISGEIKNEMESLKTDAAAFSLPNSDFGSLMESIGFSPSLDSLTKVLSELAPNTQGGKPSALTQFLNDSETKTLQEGVSKQKNSLTGSRNISAFKTALPKDEKSIFSKLIAWLGF